MKRINIIALFSVIILFSVSSWADTTIVFQETKDKGSQKAEQQMYVSNGKVRLGNEAINGSYIIFKSKTRTMTTISQRDHSYAMIDEGTFTEISSSMSDAQKQAMAQMEERLKTLPPEKQKQMRSVMENVMKHSVPTGKKPESIRYVPLTQTLTVNGYHCKVIETHKGKRKISELCMVNRKDLNIPKEDYVTLLDFQAFMQEMASKMPGGSQNAFDLNLGYSAHEQFPVQIIRFHKDGSTSHHQLVRISNDSIAEDKFIVPAGYRERRLTR